MIKCAECGHDISDKATTCPHCGAPVSISIEPENDCTITFIREKGDRYSFQQISIKLDGKQLDTLQPGQANEYDAAIGNHAVEVYAGKNCVGTTQVFVDGSSDLTLRFYLRGKGDVVFELSGATKPGRTPTYIIPTASETIASAKGKENAELSKFLIGAVFAIVAFIVFMIVLATDGDSMVNTINDVFGLSHDVHVTIHTR